MSFKKEKNIIKHTVKIEVRKYLHLVFAIICVLSFVFIIAPAIDKINGVEPIVEFINDREIDAGALFYTDLEIFSTAELYVSTSLKYRPGSKSLFQFVINN
jgi:hypothetical protein